MNNSNQQSVNITVNQTNHFINVPDNQINSLEDNEGGDEEQAIPDDIKSSKGIFLIKNFFTKVNIGIFGFYIDQFLSFLVSPVQIFSFCSRKKFDAVFSFQKRVKYVKLCEDKFQNELEISNVIDKLRKVDTLLNNLPSKELKNL